MSTPFLLAHKGRLLLSSRKHYLFLPHSAPQAASISARYPLGQWQGQTVQLWLLADDAECAEALEPAPLRPLLASSVDAQEYLLLSRAAQLATWHATHRFCGRCATALTLHPSDLARQCPACGLVQYPRISPCIIVLVVDGARCLLARAPHFPPGRFSTLAGFIEAGESAEAAVHREVREEVGIEISNVRYAQSQSWPFPHSLMLGFYADYAGGELRPDGVEIEQAGWFERASLPDLPPSFAISYQLIEPFIKGQIV